LGQDIARTAQVLRTDRTEKEAANNRSRRTLNCRPEWVANSSESDRASRRLAENGKRAVKAVSDGTAQPV